MYVDFEIREKVYLLTAYTKNEKDNLSQSERNQLKNWFKFSAMKMPKIKEAVV